MSLVPKEALLQAFSGALGGLKNPSQPEQIEFAQIATRFARYVSS